MLDNLYKYKRFTEITVLEMLGHVPALVEFYRGPHGRWHHNDGNMCGETISQDRKPKNLGNCQAYFVSLLQKTNAGIPGKYFLLSTHSRLPGSEVPLLKIPHHLPVSRHWQPWFPHMSSWGMSSIQTTADSDVAIVKTADVLQRRDVECWWASQ